VREAAAAREAQLPPGALVIHEVPLLFEGDFWRTLDANIVVIAPPAIRIARVIARDGVGAADVEARMAAQIDPQAAVALADFVIDNDGDAARLAERARRVFAALRDPAP
jgi:dephospho-CoA kinase